MAANKEQLEAYQADITELLAKNMRDALERADGAGETLSPSMWKEIREYLKQNGVSDDPTRPGSEVGKLKQVQPDHPFDSVDNEIL